MLTGPPCARELFDFPKASAGAFNVDAPVARFLLAKLAETRGAAGILSAALRKAERVEQPTLPLRTPYDASDLVGARVIFHQPKHEVLIQRIVVARAARVAIRPSSMMVDFVERFPVWDGR